MKQKFSPALTGRGDDEPDALDQFVRGEIARMRCLDGMVLGRHCSIKERRAALAEIKGICLRLGSMTMKSPEIIAEIEPEIVAETKAEGTVAGRKALYPHSEKRDPIINTA